MSVGLGAGLPICRFQYQSRVSGILASFANVRAKSRLARHRSINSAIFPPLLFAPAHAPPPKHAASGITGRWTRTGFVGRLPFSHKVGFVHRRVRCKLLILDADDKRLVAHVVEAGHEQVRLLALRLT